MSSLSQCAIQLEQSGAGLQTETGSIILKQGHDCTQPTAIITIDGDPTAWYAGQGMIGLRGDDSYDKYDTDAEMTFTWTVEQQPTGSNISFTQAGTDIVATPMIGGTYVFKLTVTNTLGSVGEITSTNIIPEFSSTPTANAGTDRLGMKNVTLALNGTGSFDMDGDTLTYKWTVLTKPAGATINFNSTTTVSPQIVADKSGVYEIELEVEDPDGNKSTDTVAVEISNRLQTIQFTDIGPISLSDLAPPKLDPATENSYIGRSMSKFALNCATGEDPDSYALTQLSTVSELINNNLVTTTGGMTKPYKMGQSYGMVCCQPPETFNLVGAGIRSFKLFFSTDNSYSIDNYELQVALDAGFTNIIHSEILPATTNDWSASNACPVTQYYARVRTKKAFTNPNHTCYSGWAVMPVHTIDMADGIDIVYCIDNTGSMGPHIGSVRAATNTIVSTLDGITDNWRIAGVSYNDPGATDRFDWSTDASYIAAEVAKFGAYGGGDAPEATYYGVGVSLTKTFRPNVAKMIIIITDITSKATNGWDATRAINAANDKGVMLVGVHTTTNGLNQLKQLSDGTGGVSITAGAGVGPAMSDLFTTHLVPSCGSNGIVQGETSLT